MVDVYLPFRPVAKLSAYPLNNVRQILNWPVTLMRAVFRRRSNRPDSFPAFFSRLLTTRWSPLLPSRSLRQAQASLDRALFSALLDSWTQAVESTRCHGTLRH